MDDSFHLIPSHAGIAGNEEDHLLAKTGTINARLILTVTLKTARSNSRRRSIQEAGSHPKDVTRRKNLGALTGKSIRHDLPRPLFTEAFRCTTGRDCHPAYLHRLVHTDVHTASAAAWLPLTFTNTPPLQTLL